MKTKILSNKIQCNKCKDIIESQYVHDFKWCNCGSVAVDGGAEYLKRCGYDYTDLSEVEEISDTFTLICNKCGKKVELSQTIDYLLYDRLNRHDRNSKISIDVNYEGLISIWCQSCDASIDDVI